MTSLFIFPTAIVHNNSMYLAHHALLLGHQYKNRFPQDLRDNILTTVDLAHELRKMATATFLRAMQGHRTALIDTLRESCGKCNKNIFVLHQ